VGGMHICCRVENVGLFSENVGLFSENVGLFSENVGLFSENVGLFSECVGLLYDKENIHENKVISIKTLGEALFKREQ